MSTFAMELPLFPLNIVLFPGTVKPLHVFEPRYRQMIKDCQSENKPFGLVLAKPESRYMQEEPYAIGTMAEIHHLTRLDDGGYDLVAFGTKRFRIISQHHDNLYLSGLVEPFEDAAAPEEELAEHCRQAHALFQSYLNLLLEAANERDLNTNLPEKPEALSHFIINFLDINDEQKQYYLELDSTIERLQAGIAILRREIPFMRQILFKRLSEEQTMLN